jgi:hypothetical protein
LFARARGVNDDGGSKVDKTRKDLPASDQLSQLRVAAASQELDRVGGHVVLCCVRLSVMAGKRDEQARCQM